MLYGGVYPNSREVTEKRITFPTDSVVTEEEHYRNMAHLDNIIEGHASWSRHDYAADGFPWG